MQRFGLEVLVGCVMLLAMVGLAYLSLQRGELGADQENTYVVTALFPSVAGLRVRAPVELAGVPIGRVEQIALRDYTAVVTLRLRQDIQLQEDAILSIRTRGLIGEKYLMITPGGSERLVAEGGRLREVEPPFDFETLLGRFVQGSVN